MAAPTRHPEYGLLEPLSDRLSANVANTSEWRRASVVMHC